jgi:PQQ-like domain
VWARRSILAAVLIGAAIIPGRASSGPAARCAAGRCQQSTGVIRWTRLLPGSWTAEGGALGTVLAAGQAFAGVGGGVVAVGFGVTVVAYRLSDGAPLWTASPGAFPAGSAIDSVRAWAGVVTAGVAIPAGVGGAARRDEVVLSGATGLRIATFPAAVYGGAVSADPAATVIVGTQAVTSYSNASGKVIWRRQTGTVAQAWRVAGDDLFVTVAKGGYLGASPVTALQRIDLRTGAQQILKAAGGSFAGTLSSAIGAAVLFSGAAGLSAYSQASGRLLWHRAGVVPQVADAVRQVLYVSSGRALIGLDPVTGKVRTSSAALGAGLYAVSGGVAFGLDEGALGDAWGYDLARKRVIWTAKTVPWPHFFADLSGIGGSANPGGGPVVLASCAQLGVAGESGAAPCLRPELVAIRP